MEQILDKLKNLIETNAIWLLLGFAGISLLLLILVIVLFVKQRKLRQRISSFFVWGAEENMEEVMRRTIEDNKKIKVQLKNNTNQLVEINEDLNTAFRKVGIVKYNAFPGMAGKVSSVIALLNNENNGIIINSIHGQEGCYTYVKEIMNGKSINPLTKEDEEALKSALEMQI